jgi:hypothetical protein
MSVQGDANRMLYGSCSTAAATVAKTVDCAGFALITGARIIVKFTVTNTASSPTLNVNSTGAAAIYYRGAAISAGYLAANRTYEFVYNGTQWELIGDIDTNTNTTYSAGTGISLSGTTFSNSGVRSIASGSTNGTISVNTGGTSAEVSVKGLGTAAYTASTAYAASSHTHTKSQITDFPSTLPNANAITIKLNSGTTEGTNLFTYTGSAAKTIDITPSAIGAAASSHGTHVSFTTTTPVMNGTASAGSASTVSRSDHVHPTDTSRAAASHTHTKSQITDFPSTLPNANAITIKLNSGSTEGTDLFTYTGSAAKTIDITPSAIGAAASSHGTHVSYGTSSPAANGTASAGSASTVSRSDHVHPLQTTVSGNAGTATKWATARNLEGMSVQGDANRMLYGSCSTAAATTEKAVACTGFALVTGARIIVKFTVTNTASSPTLNVNSTGAAAIYYRGSAISAGYLAANRTYEFVYNGTQWELIGDLDTNTNTTYSAGTGISLSGTTFSNAGVRSISSGSTNGTISVNTGGTSAEVSVAGLGSAAYTASTAYAASSHTHSYAGASSAGGSATSAVKLDTSTAGSATQPVYFSSGKPVACSYTIATSVPSGAKFTDTNTTYSAGTGITLSGTTFSRTADASGTVRLIAASGKESTLAGMYGGTWTSIGEMVLTTGSTDYTIYVYKKS